ncbi:MAG: histidine kinase, partial [Bacteroidota bacterium]
LHPDKIRKLFINFYQLSNGDVCAGGVTGVVILTEDGTIKKMLTSADGLVGKEVRAFYEDQEGLLWIGASAGGLYCYEKGVLTSINRKKQCALPPDIFTLAKAGDGRLYITTNNGLWAVDETKLRDFYRNKLNQLVPFHYDEAHGILNTEFNGGFQNNYAIGNDGRLFFPTVQGLVTFTPPATVETPFSAYIDHVLIDGISSDTLPGILDSSTKNIEIIAASINQESSRNSYLQYKLEREGVASVWSALSKETKFGLLLSAPGDYSLYLRVVDACNPEFSPVRVYSFTIKPHIYENKWFQITGIIIGLVLSAIIIRLIVTNREKEREKAFQIKTTILTLEMQALQSRMNPHFVFNILNNLKSLVSLGRTDKAEKIISNFSVLVRKAFEKSSETALPLGEEIGLVELYLKLQQERFDNSFTFHIRCPEILRNKQVPSFILQPLVENSVIHGIAHSEKECHIEVECTGEEGKLVIVVRDNGIGRTQSGKINRNKPNHQSKGLELIEKKIQIAREIYDMNISLSFEDADPVSGEGTVATLKISYHA